MEEKTLVKSVFALRYPEITMVYVIFDVHWDE